MAGLSMITKKILLRQILLRTEQRKTKCRWENNELFVYAMAFFNFSQYFFKAFRMSPASFEEILAQVDKSYRVNKYFFHLQT